MKNSIIFGIISILLIAICVALAVYCYQTHYNMWIAEYNAQIAANGIYKEDLHLLNQFAESVKWGWLFAGTIVFGIAGFLVGALAIVKALDYYDHVHVGW